MYKYRFATWELRAATSQVQVLPLRFPSNSLAGAAFCPRRPRRQLSAELQVAEGAEGAPLPVAVGEPVA